MGRDRESDEFSSVATELIIATQCLQCNAALPDQPMAAARPRTHSSHGLRQLQGPGAHGSHRGWQWQQQWGDRGGTFL